MFNNNEQLKTLEANLDKAVRLSNIKATSAERFANLHLNCPRSRWLTAATTKALMELKDPEGRAEHRQPGTTGHRPAFRGSLGGTTLPQNPDRHPVLVEEFLEFNKQLCANLNKLSKNAGWFRSGHQRRQEHVDLATAAFTTTTCTAKKVGTELAEASALFEAIQRPRPPAPPWLAPPPPPRSNPSRTR